MLLNLVTVSFGTYSHNFQVFIYICTCIHGYINANVYNPEILYFKNVYV